MALALSIVTAPAPTEVVPGEPTVLEPSDETTKVPASTVVAPV